MLLAYADNILILEDSQNEIEESTKRLIKSSKRMKLNINESKTKYMVMNRSLRIMQNITLGKYAF